MLHGQSLRGVAQPYEIDDDGGLMGSSVVYKFGRSTGLTEGRLMAVDFYGDVNYETGLARFHKQLIIKSVSDNITPFSMPGDSGSAVFNNEFELVGLLFGGSKFETQVNPAHLVLSRAAEILHANSMRVVTL
jgi:hypothetical protein